MALRSYAQFLCLLYWYTALEFQWLCSQRFWLLLCFMFHYRQGGQTDVRRARLTLSVSKKALQTVGQTDVHMDRLTEHRFLTIDWFGRQVSMKIPWDRLRQNTLTTGIVTTQLNHNSTKLKITKVVFDMKMTLHTTTTTHHWQLNVGNISTVTSPILTKF